MSVSLREIQEKFLSDVIHTQTDAVGNSQIVSSSYLPRDGFKGEDLIQVYRNNYALSLTEALGATYGAVKRLVGEDFFSYIAKQFIQKYPLSSSYLNDFGDEFADFIAGHELCQTLPYLSCVARLERCYEKAYHAAEKPQYDLRQISNLAGAEDFHIDIHPAVQLMQSKYPVMDIWLMDETSAVPQLEQNPQIVIIYRSEYKVQVELLEESEFQLIGQIMKHKSIQESLEVVDDTFDLQHFLLKYINKQIFVGFKY